VVDLTWTVRTTLDWTQGYLERHQDPQPRLSAQWLVGYATSLTRIQLYMDIDRPLSKPELALLHDAVERRGAHEPLQYICRKAPFRFLELSVEPGVLIPRPETELLVDEVISYLKQAAVADSEDVCFSGIDIGTGSGNIALSIAHEFKQVHMYALDVSEDALRVAKQNADDLQLSDRISFYESDVLSALPASLYGQIDFIVSNPPYIPTEVYDQLTPEVKEYEPGLALDGGADGLDVFRKILGQSHSALKDDGLLVCELHETTLQVAANLAEQEGYHSIKIVRDLNRKDRIISMKK